MWDPSFPLIDLHRHLDGSVRLATILELGQQHGLALPADTLEGLRPFVQVSDPQPGVMAFLEKFAWMTGVLVDLQACRRIAYENVEDAAGEGIAYIELRFSPWFMSLPFSLSPTAVVEAVIDGAQAAAVDHPVKIGLIGVLSRTYGLEACRQELEALLAHADHLVGIDLAGDEARWPAEWFEDHFRRVHAAGLKVTIHAGESDGARSIWRALQTLGATRIGHALRAIDDPALIEFMAARRIGIESSLTSNVQTSCVRDYASHPLKQFLEHGLLATINTDDPGISAIDLPHEYQVAAPAAGLSAAQIRQAQRNALEIAFLTEDQRRALLEPMPQTRPPGISGGG